VRPVIVGVSGGVDSAVALQRLSREGCATRAVTLKLWPGEDERSCCSPVAQRRARDAAAAVAAPFELLDDEAGFARTVVEPFVAAYLGGETPNPCVVCNRRRFALLARLAGERGAAAVASGHYARIEWHGGRPYVLRGVDHTKDQSYMLWMLGEETLARLELPLGELTKREVREEARALGLEAADVPESQEVCFAPDGYRRFLSSYGVEPRRGDVVDRRGRTLGEHEGHWLYTIGQRRGIAVPGGPWYVLERRAAANEIVIGRADELDGQVLLLRDVVDRDVVEDAADDGAPLLVQLRYRSAAVPVRRLERGPDGRLRVELVDPVSAPAPGQSAVFYRGARVVGGGVLDEVIRP
jgi:tRNA-specific 2-thiouridylase